MGLVDRCIILSIDGEKNFASKAIAEKKEKGVKIADIAEDYDHYFILYVSRKNVKHGVDKNEQNKFGYLQAERTVFKYCHLSGIDYK